jgi:transposase
MQNKKKDKTIIIKSYRLTSKNANMNKRKLIYSVLDEAYKIKNDMSKFIYDNLHKLNDKNFIGNYKQWNNSIYLNSHTLQTIFTDITKLYQNHIKQLINNTTNKIRIWDGFKYSKKSRNNIPKYKTTIICKIIRYLIKASNLESYTLNRADELFNKSKVDELKDNWNKLDRNKKKYIIKIVNNKIIRIRKKIKIIKFSNGTFRLTSSSGYSYEIIEDIENRKYKFFLKLRFKNNIVIHLPLLLERESKNKRSKKYFDKILSGELNKQIFIIDRRNQTNSKKLFFAISREEKLTFRDFGKIVGCDINLTSEKFITASNGTAVSYNEKIIKEFLRFIQQIDQKGYRDLTDNEKRKLRKYVRKLRSHIEYLIAIFVNELVKNGYTDIILEDLQIFRNGKFKINLFGFVMKLNRFVRFLHLTDLKNKFIQICHNRGVRVHLTKSAYTSKQCPICGHIDDKNRQTQSLFKCTKCGYTYNADFNASINILLRYIFNAYKEKLHSINEYNELRPKTISTKEFKDKLISLFNQEKVLKTIVNQVDVLPDDFKQEIQNKLEESGFHCPVPQ